MKEHIEHKRFPWLMRRPLSANGRLTVAMLLSSTVLTAALRISIGPNAAPLSYVAIGLWVCALLVALGIRWALFLAALENAGCLVAFYLQPFVAYHLTQPGLDLYRFSIIVLLIVFIFIGLWASIAALVQSYLRHERSMPFWLLLAYSGMMGIALGAILIGAIVPPPATSAPGGTSYTNGVPTVHMGITSFLSPSVTIQKGSKLLLVDDGSYLHVLFNGRWANGQPQPEHQAGAPVVNNLNINGNSAEIGPFVTAGTYHIYCSIHPNMTLTIIVQ